MTSKLCTAGLLPCLALLLAGCAGDRFEYTPVGEMQDGPGMFTGESGEAIFSLRREPGAGTAGDSDPPGDYSEFLEYQAFRDWKDNNANSDEHREFQLWREWREQRTAR